MAILSGMILILSLKGKLVYGLLGVFLCTVLNHIFLVNSVALAFGAKQQGADRLGFKILAFFLGKTVFLGAGFFWAVHHMGPKVIYGLTLYIFQLIILALSIKKNH